MTVDGDSPFGVDPVEDAAFREAMRNLELQAGPAPYPVTGYENTGTVGVQVDEHHRPVRLELRRHWTAEYRSNELASAILSAYSAALKVQHRDAREADADEREKSSLPIAPDVLDYPGVPRSAERIEADAKITLEHAMEVADRLIAKIPSEPHFEKDVIGNPRTVSVQLRGPFLIGCQVNGDWVDNADPSRIMNEFYGALERAREEESEQDAERFELSSLEREASALIGEMQELSREAIAALRSRLTEE